MAEIYGELLGSAGMETLELKRRRGECDEKCHPMRGGIKGAP
jgi:hypothetical protein